MSSAADVLALQATTRDYMRGQDWRTYLSGTARDCVRTFGAVLSGDIATQADREVERLTTASAFHVHDEAMPLLIWAARQLPEDATWQVEMAPAERGFLVLPRTFSMEQIGIENVSLISELGAISWQVGPDVLGRDGVHLTVYGNTEGAIESAEELRQRVAKMKVQAAEAGVEFNAGGRSVPDVEHLRRYGPLYGLGIDHPRWGEEVEADPLPTRRGEHPLLDAALNGPGRPADDAVKSLFLARRAAARRVLFAYWLLMGQTIVVTEREDLTPGQTRAWTKRRVPPHVTVIRMRRTEGAQRGQGESLVEWSIRWVVKGHWRRQPYGPGRTKTRLTWVAPYVKGPADKPLHVSQKVYSLMH